MPHNIRQLAGEILWKSVKTFGSIATFNTIRKGNYHQLFESLVAKQVMSKAFIQVLPNIPQIEADAIAQEIKLWCGREYHLAGFIASRTGSENIDDALLSVPAEFEIAEGMEHLGQAHSMVLRGELPAIFWTESVPTKPYLMTQILNGQKSPVPFIMADAQAHMTNDGRHYSTGRIFVPHPVVPDPWPLLAPNVRSYRGDLACFDHGYFLRVCSSW